MCCVCQIEAHMGFIGTHDIVAFKNIFKTLANRTLKKNYPSVDFCVLLKCNNWSYDHDFPVI